MVTKLRARSMSRRQIGPPTIVSATARIWRIRSRISASPFPVLAHDRRVGVLQHVVQHVAGQGHVVHQAGRPQNELGHQVERIDKIGNRAGQLGLVLAAHALVAAEPDHQHEQVGPARI